MPTPRQVIRPTFYVTVNRLNLRAGPGMYFFKVSVLGRNTEVEKLGDAENWSKIRVKQTGDEGWVDSRYLSATPVTSPPGVEPPPARGGAACARPRWSRFAPRAAGGETDASGKTGAAGRARA